MKRLNSARASSDVQALASFSPRLVASSNDRRLTATLMMSESASQRLLSVLASGTTDFRLSAADGSLMLRLRLAVSTASAAEEHIKDRLFIDWSRSTVSNESNRVRLSRTELRLLEALLRAKGSTVTRLQLIERVWAGSNLRRSERENALTVYICTLRKRLGGIGLNGALHTVRRMGYRLAL
jgi:DNA-binding response OmpR family regulator